MSDLPHVTRILKDAGLIDADWFTDEARERGRAVHLATQFLDEGDVDWESVEASGVSLQVRQYQIFLDQVRPEILAIEERVENKALQYCGRLDRRVRINGREGILDIKSPWQSPFQAIQVSMYAACFDRPMARWTLHLSEENYKLRQHTGRRDWDVAKAAITIAAWRNHDGH